MLTVKPRLIRFIPVLLLGLLVGAGCACAQSITFQFVGTEYRDVFQTIGEIAGLNVLVDASVSGTGSFNFQDVELEQALEIVAQFSGTDYVIKNNTLLVAAKERLAELQANRLYYLHTVYVAPEQLVPVLSMIIPAENIHALNDANLLIIYSSPEQFKIAQEVVDTLDVPPSMLNPNTAVDREPLDLGDTIKIYRLSYADPVVTGKMLQLIVPADKIQIDEGTKSVLIRGTEKQIAEVDQFMVEFDRPLPQVLMEVWIHEVSDDASDVFGFGWNGSLPGAKVGSSDPNGLFHMELNWEPWEIIFTLEALEKEGKAKILASPKIAALSGEEAVIFVGDQIPIVLTDKDGEQRIEFLESGINLRVRPRISEDGFVTIDVRPEASLFVFTEESEYPQIRTRQAHTTVRVKDGQPVLIGGLIQEQDQESVNKVPFLGDLPIFGRLFRKTNTTTERTEMSIILIPRIVDGEQGLIGSSLLPAAQ